MSNAISPAMIAMGPRLAFIVAAKVKAATLSAFTVITALL
jgi:hypothetical protein